MFWLIETQEQFDKLQFELGPEIFVLPVQRHPEMHPGIYAPLCLYLRDVTQPKGFLVNYFHPEALQFDSLQVKEYLRTFKKIFTPDKKALSHTYFGTNTYDLNLFEYKEVKKQTHAHSYFSQRYHTEEDLNSVIPIVKHFEQCEIIFEEYTSVIKKYVPNEYHDDLSNVFWFIERNGLKVNSAFERYFDLKRPFLSRYNSYTFTQYNLNTTTGRPSNTFNSLNFAALPKESGARSVFIPRNDFLLEIDLTAYHPTLIGQMVGYNSPTGDIYEDFAAKYGMDRTEAKGLVFKQLYGHIFDQYKDFEFFQLTQKLIEQIWITFTKTGKYTVEQTGKVFKQSDLPNMNPQKLFNYIIQHWETYNNVALLKEILYIINNSETRLVLYTYDAFLLDTSKEDKDKIKQILQVFNDRNLKIKTSYGTDYDTLQSL
jgi:hypothetical protein